MPHRIASHCIINNTPGCFDIHYVSLLYMHRIHTGMACTHVCITHICAYIKYISYTYIITYAYLTLYMHCVSFTHTCIHYITYIRKLALHHRTLHIILHTLHISQKCMTYIYIYTQCMTYIICIVCITHITSYQIPT